MSERRFFIKSKNIKDGYISFDGDTFNHIARVLRLPVGEQILLVDERAAIYEAVIDQISRDWLVAKIVSGREKAEDDGAVAIRLFQALPKGEKLDFVIQKGTELGVSEFVIFGARRSVAKVGKENCSAKLARWNRIASEAARQCGRDSVPEVVWSDDPVTELQSSPESLKLLLWEGEERNTLRMVADASAKPSEITVIVGPEGGFEESESAAFIQAGVIPVTLGRRILRTETAALATVAVLQYIWGDIA